LPGSSLKDPAALLAGRQTSLATYQEKYGIAHGSPVGSPEDARAAGAAGKGMAAEENTDEGCDEKTSNKRTADEAESRGLELGRQASETSTRHRKECLHDADHNALDRTLHKAYTKETVRLYDEANRCLEEAWRKKQATGGRPAPDDIGTAPHRASPPLSSPPPRPASATRPVVDGGVTVQRTPVVVHGTMPTNPAVDRGREYHAPHRGPVKVVVARPAAAINWGNQR
jgi:hypothetical protein